MGYTAPGFAEGFAAMSRCVDDLTPGKAGGCMRCQFPDTLTNCVICRCFGVEWLVGKP